MALELHIEDHEFYKAGELAAEQKAEQRMLAVAEALLIDGLPLKQVMNATGLTLLQITELHLRLSKKKE